MIFISVLLPAPFSPSTAWISPGITVRIDVLVGDDGRVDLADAAQLEARRRGGSSRLAVRLEPDRVHRADRARDGERRPCGRLQPAAPRARCAPAAAAPRPRWRSSPGSLPVMPAMPIGHVIAAKRAAGMPRARQPLLELPPLRQRADQAEIREVVALQNALGERSSSGWLCVITRKYAPGGAAATSASGVSVHDADDVVGDRRRETRRRACRPT